MAQIGVGAGQSSHPTTQTEDSLPMSHLAIQVAEQGGGDPSQPQCARSQAGGYPNPGDKRHEGCVRPLQPRGDQPRRHHQPLPASLRPGVGSLLKLASRNLSPSHGSVKAQRQFAVSQGCLRRLRGVFSSCMDGSGGSKISLCDE